MFTKQINTRFLSISFAILFFIFTFEIQYAIAASPYYGAARHYVSISLSGGYAQNFITAAFDQNIGRQVSAMGNGGSHLGFGYEYQNRSFWFSLGIEGQILMGTHYLSMIEDIRMPIFDTQGKLAQMNYHINQHQGNELKTFVNLPLMLGYCHSDGFYFGGGLKIGYGIYAVDNIKVNYTTSATYPSYVDDFSAMQNHYYGQYEATNRENIPLAFHGALIAEVGYDVLTNTRLSSRAACRILRIGLFAEYGAVTTKKAISHELLISPNPNNACLVTPHSFYNTNPGVSFIMPFYAGIKMTILLRMSTPHSQCNCF